MRCRWNSNRSMGKPSVVSDRGIKHSNVHLNTKEAERQEKMIARPPTTVQTGRWPIKFQCNCPPPPPHMGRWGKNQNQNAPPTLNGNKAHPLHQTSFAVAWHFFSASSSSSIGFSLGRPANGYRPLCGTRGSSGRKLRGNAQPDQFKMWTLDSTPTLCKWPREVPQRARLFIWFEMFYNFFFF